MKADLLEEFERNKLEAEVRKSYEILSQMIDTQKFRADLIIFVFRCKQSYKRRNKSYGMHNSFSWLLCLKEFNVIGMSNLNIGSKTPKDLSSATRTF